MATIGLSPVDWLIIGIYFAFIISGIGYYLKRYTKSAEEAHNLTPEDAAKLGAFVRAGGGLLAYMGESTREEPMNRLFLEANGEGLLPMRLGPLHADPEHPVAFDLDDERVQRHPLYEDTKDHAWLFSPEVVAYRRVTDYTEGAVVARYDNGEPAALEKTFGRGRVVVLTTSPDERNFRLNGSLLPDVLFFNAAHYLVCEPQGLRNVTVGGGSSAPASAPSGRSRSSSRSARSRSRRGWTGRSAR